MVGGVRNPATKDTPVAFEKDSAFRWSADEARKDAPVSWTQFGEQKSEFRGSPDGGVVSGGEERGGGITEWAGRMQEFRSNGSR